MRSKKVLYISASIGLGHVNKDLAIANELRKQNPRAEVKWLAAHPASDALEKRGKGCCRMPNGLGVAPFPLKVPQPVPD